MKDIKIKSGHAKGNINEKIIIRLYKRCNISTFFAFMQRLVFGKYCPKKDV